MAEQFHTPTADDLAGRGYKRLPGEALIAGRAGKLRAGYYWANPETGHRVLVMASRKAGKPAGRGHWRFNPLASWCRWHFGRGK